MDPSFLPHIYFPQYIAHSIKEHEYGTIASIFTHITSCESFEIMLDQTLFYMGVHDPKSFYQLVHVLPDCKPDVIRQIVRKPSFCTFISSHWSTYFYLNQNIAGFHLPLSELIRGYISRIHIRLITFFRKKKGDVLKCK